MFLFTGHMSKQLAARSPFGPLRTLLEALNHAKAAQINSLLNTLPQLVIARICSPCWRMLRWIIVWPQRERQSEAGERHLMSGGVPSMFLKNMYSIYVFIYFFQIDVHLLLVSHPAESPSSVTERHEWGFGYFCSFLAGALTFHSCCCRGVLHKHSSLSGGSLIAAATLQPLAPRINKISSSLLNPLCGRPQRNTTQKIT